MKNLLIVCLLMFMYHDSVAQQRGVIMKYHVSHLKMKACYPKDSVASDKTRLIVDYRYSFVVPSAKDTLQWAIIRTEIGRQTIIQKDMYLYYDRIRAFVDDDHKQRYIDLRDRSGTGPSNLFVDLVYNRTDKTMHVTCGDYFDPDAGKEYRQPLPELQWEILPEQDTINGYACQVARTVYGGRKWCVWWAMDIPVQVGPWKLAGLPGLILRAADDAGHKFDVAQIRQERVPMCRYIYHSQDFKTVGRFLRYERNYHEHPYDILGNGGEIFIVTLDKNGNGVFKGKDWTIPYNPIELE